MSGIKRCVLIIADGARFDVFNNLIDSGELPVLGRIRSYGDLFKAVTVFPSTSGPAYTPFLTGAHPGECNIPGIRWFDRTKANGHLLTNGSLRSYVGLGSYKLNTDIQENVPTIFELLPKAISIGSPLDRGYKRKVWSSLWLDILHGYGHLSGQYQYLDESITDQLQSALKTDSNFIFCIFHGIDGLSHITSPYSEETIAQYYGLNQRVKLIIDTLGDEFDKTLLLISSDHGHMPIHSHLDLAGLLSNNGYPCLEYPNVFRSLKRVRAICLTSGNAMAHIYISHPILGWSSKPSHEELQTVAGLLLDNKEVDIVCCRLPGSQFLVLSRRGRATIERQRNFILYSVDGSDPFSYRVLPNRFSTEECLSLTAETDYPDAISQILQLFTSPRTGDLVVSATPGFDLRARFEVPEHRSSHGSLHKEHMYVPILTSQPVGRSIARTTTLFEVIRNSLNA